jgi:ATPase subunit of ABC transporter with duplicated ATPase domains
MSYACAEKYSSEVRDRSDYRERIVSALQLLNPQKVKELVKAKSEENKARKQAEMEAKKQAKKEAKEQEKAQKLREKEIQREMRMLERQREREAKKQEKGLKRRTKKEPWTDWYNDVEDDTPVETQIVRVKRINAEGKHVAKGTPGGDYLLDIDNNVYCANKREIVGKWSKMEERIVFNR